MARNTPRGNYYKDRNKEAEDEFFDAPEEYRKSSEPQVFEKEEKTSGGGKIAAIVLVGLVAILGVLVAAYILLMNQGKVPEVGPLTTTSIATETVTLPGDTLEDGTLPGEGANIVINGTTVGNTSNAGGNAARKTTVTAATNAYVTDSNKITSSMVKAMIDRSAKSNGDVLIWDNIIEDDTDLTHYNYTYQAAYYRATSEDEDIHAIRKNTVYTFLTATNKDPSQEEKGMLVLHSENVYNKDGQLVAEYTEGEMDRYTDADSFIQSYMANKSGFTKVS